jgi:hypothetical protein
LLYSGGTFTTIDYPFNSNTFARGISDSGQIVGPAYLCVCPRGRHASRHSRHARS